MDLRQLTASQTDVSLKLANQVLIKEAKHSNAVFSPLSIQLILALISAGSKGPAQQEILKFFKSRSIDHLNSFSSHLINSVFSDHRSAVAPTLLFANGLWVDQSTPLKASFRNVVENSYKATARQVNFQTKHAKVITEVNQWAKKKTSGLIEEVLPAGSVDNTTRLIFVNALYFKGAWAEKFDASKTKNHDFHLLDGSAVQVPFMTSKRKQFIQLSDDFRVLKLSYEQTKGNSSFSMYFFLPDAKDGLPALLKKASEPGFLYHHIPFEQVEVGEFLIPKLKIHFAFEASKALKGLGLVSPFSGDGPAEMVDSPVAGNLRVSSIFHKAVIEVNEEGTEAAAASAAVIMLKAAPMFDKLDFVADHPFLFVIREDTTGAVLFMGQVLNPLAERAQVVLPERKTPCGSSLCSVM